ncbi:RNA polymerase sigma-I factor [Gracilibacillus kekensis]|uniref:RNA polymerase sigma factor SigI n=1 Tax=Gracilibacillus kekensis TaxID=1027249 RepID=A0A1M7N0C1_9BACI|nr:RNA polymerase sigma-I factor [Gracilibacillus kekensis]SHM96369.1 RNA polymerase sigma factor [Gracilibacillus kekensis]
MNPEDIEHSIAEIQKGNEALREQLIRYYQPYILNVVGQVCKQFKTWNDDEASIGLIAFNRAIDTYKPSKGRTFLNYVYLLIHRELIDYFRKENRYKEVIRSDGELLKPVEVQKSFDQYLYEQEVSNITEEIIAFNEELSFFYIRFGELESFCPKQKRSRKKVLQIAEDFIQQSDLIQQLFQKKHFPMKDFINRTSYRIKAVEKYRKYLIAVIIILLHPEWENLQAYVSGEREREKWPIKR